MIDIRFLITPKSDLPYYYSIFIKPDPLGMEIKTVFCFILVTMLYIYIQNRKEAMKTAIFWQEAGGNKAVMERLMMDTKGCGQLTSNDT